MVLSTYVYVFLKVDGYNIPRTWPSFDCALAYLNPPSLLDSTPCTESFCCSYYVYASPSARFSVPSSEYSDGHPNSLDIYSSLSLNNESKTTITTSLNHISLA